MRIFYAYLLSLTGIVAVAAPAFWPQGRDSFPLSSYPMFSRDLSQAQHAVLIRATGILPDGRHIVLPPHVVANGEVMQAYATLRQVVELCPQTCPAFCAAIAQRLLFADDAQLRSVRVVEIGAFDYRPLDYFVHRSEPIALKTFARCAVNNDLPRGRLQ